MKLRYDLIHELFKVIWIKRTEISSISILSYLTLFFQFLTQVTLARLLGPNDYGKFAATVALIAIIEVPLIVRTSEITLRNLIKLKDNLGIYISFEKKLLITDVKLLIGAYLFLLINSSWLSSLLEINIYQFILMSLVIPAQIGYGIYKSRFVIFDKIPQLVRIEFVYSLLYMTSLVISYQVLGMFGLAGGLVLMMFIKTFLAYNLTKSYIPKFSDVSQLPYKQNPADSFFSIVRSTVANGINQIDLILISFFQNSQDVALYRVAKSLASLPTKITFPIWRYLQPKLIFAIDNNDHKKMKRLIFSGTIISSLVVVLSFLITYFIGDIVIDTLYGAEYKKSLLPLLYLLFGIGLFNCVTGWFKIWSSVSKAQLSSVLIYLTIFIAFVSFGTLFGRSSINEMAFVVSAVLACGSCFIYFKIFGIK